jgi:endogenous inhibitor of DNA gyrase (YacG/DUF329 family)
MSLADIVNRLNPQTRKAKAKLRPFMCHRCKQWGLTAADLAREDHVCRCGAEIDMKLVSPFVAEFEFDMPVRLSSVIRSG